MVELAHELRDRGLTVWVAGGAGGPVDEARAAGAALNLWDADPALVADRAHGPDALEVTWAGPPPTADVDELRDTRCRGAGRGAGATWARVRAGRSTSTSWWPPRRRGRRGD